MPQLDIRRGFGRAADESQRVAGQNTQNNVPTHVRNGILVKDVSVVASSKVTINHKLGRALTGWHIMRPRGAGNVHETDSNDKTLTLTESAGVAMVFDVWVY
jgi:hypothetical protein